MRSREFEGRILDLHRTVSLSRFTFLLLHVCKLLLLLPLLLLLLLMMLLLLPNPKFITQPSNSKP
jgi:hypothetical protein